MISFFKKFFKQVSTVDKSQDSISTIMDFYVNVIDSLKPLYLGNTTNAENLVLHIGLFNNEFVAAYSKDISDGKLKIGLQSEINKELGVCFNDIIIYTKEDGYPNDRNEIKNTKKCFYSVLPASIILTSSDAEIKVLLDRGVLLQNKYLLTSTDKNRIWNIGRGEISQVGKGYIRQNHIVFDDNSTNEHNKFVSRNHAHIEYSEGLGYLLYVDEGGRRNEQNRTRVIRGKDILDLESNMKIPVQLKDGDQIELGKHAILCFNMI